MKTVAILMSSYNGEKYIEDQLNSIYCQSFDGELLVVVRDDGSKDGTVSILKRFEERGLRLIVGKNIGVIGSYLELLKIAGELNCGYFMLADQDDVWLPGKIDRALNSFNEDGIPELYCSAMLLVDSDLQCIGVYSCDSDCNIGLILMKNHATGCTVAFNKKLLDVVAIPGRGDYGMVAMHDWWLALHAAAFGRIIYDRRAYILYRQHQANQVGMKIGLSSLWYRFRRFCIGNEVSQRYLQAVLFASENRVRLPRNIEFVVDYFIVSKCVLIKRVLYILKYGNGVSFLSGLRFVFWM